MKISKINFGSWYRLPKQQIEKLNPQDALQLGLTIRKFKSHKPIYSSISGIYMDIPNKKEQHFLEICDSYEIMPRKENLI